MPPPVSEIRVDPDALLDAVAERLQDGSVLDQSGDADHKIHTFRRQWNEELMCWSNRSNRSHRES